MSSPTKILILDDEATVRNSLRTFLEDYNFKTEVAESAEEAFELIEKEQFDVAIVDIRLPGMDGITFIEKASKKWNGISFLVHTGSVEFTLSEAMIANPKVSNNVILKPVFDIEEFVEEIHRLLDQNRK
jgi:CheY-like chemotaxis protein